MRKGYGSLIQYQTIIHKCELWARSRVRQPRHVTPTLMHVQVFMEEELIVLVPYEIRILAITQTRESVPFFAICHVQFIPD